MTTNYERIKQMSVEEMAELLSNKTDCFICPAYTLSQCSACVNTRQKECIEHQKQWLESEAENE